MSSEATDIYRLPGRSSRECKYWWFDGWDWLVNGALRLAGMLSVNVAAGQVAMDPHVHTMFSHCSVSRPDRVILRAAALGLGAVAVMDHHVVKGALDAINCAEDLKHRKLLREDFLVIPGVELNSDIGHIGALFVEKDLPEGLNPRETVRAIHEAGGLAIAVHPYHSTGIGDAVFDAPFDAVEVECGSVFGRDLVKANTALASDKRLTGIAKLGSSDAHYINAIGSCYTVLTVPEPSLEAAKAAIVEGHSAAVASSSCMRMRKLLGPIAKLR